MPRSFDCVFRHRGFRPAPAGEPAPPAFAVILVGGLAAGRFEPFHGLPMGPGPVLVPLDQRRAHRRGGRDGA